MACISVELIHKMAIIYVSCFFCLLTGLVEATLCCCVRCSSRNILDDFREAYFWLRQNTPEHARVMSWWDYGYQIAGIECCSPCLLIVEVILVVLYWWDSVLLNYRLYFFKLGRWRSE